MLHLHRYHDKNREQDLNARHHAARFLSKAVSKSPGAQLV